jgi:hypothetical protein
VVVLKFVVVMVVVEISMLILAGVILVVDVSR